LGFNGLYAELASTKRAGPAKLAEALAHLSASIVVDELANNICPNYSDYSAKPETKKIP
jgi:hypothetical protein